MKKRIFSVFLVIFLSFSIITSDYYKAEVNAMGAAASIFVSGGGIAAGAAAALPIVAVVGLVALAGYGIYTYIGANAAEAGMTKTQYMQDLWNRYCESNSMSATAQANAMAAEMSVARDGTIAVTGAGSSILHSFLSWISTNLDNGDIPIYAQEADIFLDGAYIGTPEVVDGKYSYSGELIWCNNIETTFYKMELHNYKYLSALLFDSNSFFYGYSLVDGSIQATTRSFMNMYVSYDKMVSWREITSNTTSVNFQGYKFYSNGANCPLFGNYDEIVTYFRTSDDSTALNKSANFDLAFIGDITDMTDAASFQGMDDLTTGDAYVLNPGVIGNLDLPQDVAADIPIAIDDYFELVGTAIDVPVDTDIDIPADIPVTVANPGLAVDVPDIVAAPTVTTPVIDVSVPDVADIPTVDVVGLEGELNPVVEWGLNYISPQKGLLSKFPFSIVYDLYLLVAAFSGSSQDAINADPKNLTITNDLNAPGATYTSNMNSAFVFNMTFKVPDGKGGKINTPVTVDLSQYEWFFRVIRYATGIIWLVGLFNWARKESN